MNNVTFQVRPNNYISRVGVFNSDGKEVGHVHCVGFSFQLVMFNRDCGKFNTLELAMGEATKIAEKKHNVQFEDSVEATQFLEKLQAMLNDQRLAAWCASSDYNFGSKTYGKLAEVSVAVAKLVDALDNAC